MLLQLPKHRRRTRSRNSAEEAPLLHRFHRYRCICNMQCYVSGRRGCTYLRKPKRYAFTPTIATVALCRWMQPLRWLRGVDHLCGSHRNLTKPFSQELKVTSYSYNYTDRLQGKLRADATPPTSSGGLSPGELPGRQKSHRCQLSQKTPQKTGKKTRAKLGGPKRGEQQILRRRTWMCETLWSTPAT